MDPDDRLDDLKNLSEKLLLFGLSNSFYLLARGLACELLETAEDELAIPKGLLGVLSWLLFSSSCAPIGHGCRGLDDSV
jgi:hypothetical protein